MPKIFLLLSGLKNYSDRKESFVISFFAFICLSFSMTAALLFLPKRSADVAFTEYKNIKDNAEKTEWTIRDSRRGVDLFLTFYDALGAESLIIVTPPILGSKGVIFPIYAELQKRGFKVITFSRPLFDSIAVNSAGEYISLKTFSTINLYLNMISGADNINAVSRQKNLSLERKNDIQFLINVLKTDNNIKEKIGFFERIFLLGYGAGGAASIELVSSAEYLKTHPEIKGVCAIESAILCEVQLEDNDNNSFALFRKKNTRLVNTPQPLLPVLYIAGESALSTEKYNRYSHIVQTMLESPSPFLFMSFNEAAAFHFSIFDEEYPVLTLFSRGKLPSIWAREKTADFNLTDLSLTDFSLIEHAAETADAFFNAILLNPTLPFLRDACFTNGAMRMETSGK